MHINYNSCFPNCAKQWRLQFGYTIIIAILSILIYVSFSMCTFKTFCQNFHMCKMISDWLACYECTFSLFCSFILYNTECTFYIHIVKYPQPFLWLYVPLSYTVLVLFGHLIMHYISTITLVTVSMACLYVHHYIQGVDKLAYLPLLGSCYVYWVTIKVLLAVRGDNLLSDSDYILLESDYII